MVNPNKPRHTLLHSPSGTVIPFSLSLEGTTCITWGLPVLALFPHLKAGGEVLESVADPRKVPVGVADGVVQNEIQFSLSSSSYPGTFFGCSAYFIHYEPIPISFLRGGCKFGAHRCALTS